MGLYAGDLTAAAAWELLSRDADAVLIDVRTPPEWQFAGVPSLATLSRKPVFLPYRNFPTYEVNENFAAALESLALKQDQNIIFLCKVGGRSIDAAILATQLGFTHAYNIASGFEGEHDANGQRGKISGWKAANLPWEQA